MIDGKWYITVAAVGQYMALMGLSGPLEDDNIDYLKAMGDLAELSHSAYLADTPPTRSGARIYRGKVTRRGKRERVEMTVQPAPNDDGSKPQLLRIILK